MKKLILLALIACITNTFGQQKTFDYAYMSKKSICVYSAAEKKEYPIVTSAMNPCISPDGKELAYTAMAKNGDRFISVIDLTTKKKTRLNTGSNNCYGPVWSPDGKHIAYNVFDSQKSDWSVAVIDTKNSKPVILTGKIKSAFMPSWCNGGKDVAVHDMDKLYVVDMAGNIVQTFDFKAFKMDMGTSSADNFIFTTDKKHIIYTAAQDLPGAKAEPPSVLFSYDVSSKAVKQLSPKGYNANGFIVKNNSILFSGSKNGANSYNVYAVNTDGSNFKLLFAGCYDISAKD